MLYVERVAYVTNKVGFDLYLDFENKQQRMLAHICIVQEEPW